MPKRISPTLSAFQEKLVIAYAYLHGVNAATVAKMGINKIIEPLDERNRNDLIRVYDKMTPEQREHPDK